MLGGIALALSYGAYVAEVYRAGIDSVHPSQRAAALAVGLTERPAMRHVVLPQAVRRVGPPLLNDFIALQKDVALVSILGVRWRRSAWRRSRPRRLQLHAAGRRRAALPVRHDPARALLDRWSAASGAALMSPPVLEVRGVTKAYGDVPVLRGIDLAVESTRPSR